LESDKNLKQSVSTNADKITKLEETNMDLSTKLHKFTDIDSYKLFQMKVGSDSNIKFWRIYYITKIDSIDMC